VAGVTKFDIIKIIGKQMGEYISETGNSFREDLVDARCTDLIVTNYGNIVVCRNN
jgi:uncharacterized protein